MKVYQLDRVEAQVCFNFPDSSSRIMPIRAEKLDKFQSSVSKAVRNFDTISDSLKPRNRLALFEVILLPSPFPVAAHSGWLSQRKASPIRIVL
jgi:hypothetical protein